MNKLLFSLMVLAGVALPYAANAGLLDGLKNTASTVGGSSDKSSSDSAGQQDRLVAAYVAANKDVLMAQYRMATALGVKDAAAKAKAEADALGSGATKDNLAESDKVQSDVSKAIAERQNDSSLKMDEAAKKEYAAGLALLGSGMLKYVGMKGELAAFQSSMSSFSPAVLTKLQSGMYVVSNFPQNSKNVYNTLSQANQFAKDRGIPVPEDATKAL